jgi:hypothetical protein
VGLGAGLDGQGKPGPPPGIDPQSFQLIENSYYAIPAAPGIDGRTILNQMLNEKYGKTWNELMWPRMETCGEFF